jgi:ATP-binding cassette subfamily C protein
MRSFANYVRRCYALLSPADRVRWLRLVPLIVVTSSIEAVGTIAIYLLVAAIADPGTVMETPVVGGVLRGFVRDGTTNLGVLLIVPVVLFYILKSATVAATEYAQAVASTRTASNLSIRLMRGYLRAPYLFHVGRNASDMVHTTTYVAGVTFGGVVSALLHIATEALVFVAILAVLIAASPGIVTIAAGVLIIVGGLVMSAMRRTSARLGQREHALSARSMRRQAQALGAVEEIMVLDRAQYFAERFAEVSRLQADIHAKSRFFQALPRITVETFFICGALAATVALLLSGSSSAQTVSLLGLFAYAGFRIIPSANRVLMHVHTVRHGQAGIDRINADLEQIEEPRDRRPPVRDDWDFSDRVLFERVSLTYPEQSRPVLDEVDLTIRRGESVAVVGSTGSGKSSIIRLLVGLLRPDRGRITVDGAGLEDVLPSWRRRLGYVPQDVHLIEDTLRRNVAFGFDDAEIDETAVLRALQRARLGEVVDGLPQGLDSSVGDRGLRLSGGERQRVGIARALYHEPHVLILDEATSSLDAKTEQEILAELRSDPRDWTLIAVTHRLASVRGFDRVVFIESGRVRAVGSFDDLVEQVEEFRHIARIGSAG